VIKRLLTYKKLEPKGFENNLEGKLTDNYWRLFTYRKSITDFEIININTLCLFADGVFKLLKRPVKKTQKSENKLAWNNYTI
jgi:hypothetical protein